MTIEPIHQFNIEKLFKIGQIGDHAPVRLEATQDVRLHQVAQGTEVPRARQPPREIGEDLLRAKQPWMGEIE